MRLAQFAVPGTLVLARVTAPLAAEAQPAGNVPWIVYLCTNPCGGPRYQALVQSLEAFAPKQIELLKEVVPALSRVGTLVDAADPASS